MNNDTIKTILEGIAAQDAHGVLRPEAVVAAAAAPEHPLHARFEWDNDKAAHAHRLHQARTLIRSVQINVTTTVRQLDVVYYVHDPRATASAGGYIALPRVRSDRELAEETIAAEFKRVEALLKRTRSIADGLSVPDAAKLADDLLRLLNARSAQAIGDATPEVCVAKAAVGA